SIFEFDGKVIDMKTSVFLCIINEKVSNTIKGTGGG
ncbi:MAG: hypothetical protein ACJA2K_001597, partial [Thalassolituus sp.]